MKKLDLPMAVKRNSLKKYVEEGSGDDSHLTADNQHAGYMDPAQYKKFLGAAGERESIDDGTDILTLAPGCYAGQNLKNTPLGENETALLYVDVSRAFQTNDHREIYVTEAYTGHMYYHNDHVNDAGKNVSAPKGWSRVEKYAPLWEGNTSKEGSVLTIADNVYKFDSLRITINNANSGEKKITVTRAAAMQAYMVYPWIGQHGFSIFGVTLKIKDPTDNGGTKLLIDRNWSYSYTDQWIDSADLAMIKKIEGVF